MERKYRFHTALFIELLFYSHPAHKENDGALTLN